MNSNNVRTTLEKRLEDLLNDVRKNGLCGMESTVEDMDKEDALDRATDALASGDMLGCLIYDTIDKM